MRTCFNALLLFAGLLFLTTSALLAQQRQADPFAPAPAAVGPFGPAPAADPFASGAAPDPFAPVTDGKESFARLAWWTVVGIQSQIQILNPPKPCELKLADENLPAATLKKMSPAELLAYQLERSIKLSLNQSMLEDLAEALKSKLQINVIFQKKAFEEAAFDTAAPIDWSAQEPIKLRLALRKLLADLSLTYVSDDGVLIITTRTAAENRQIVRTYPIDPDLLKVRKRLRPASFYQFGGRGYSGLFNLNQGGPGWTGSMGGGGGLGGGIPPLHAEYDQLDSIVDLITGIVQPVTWKTNGGMGDIIPNLQLGLLVVSNTEEVHEELAALLDVFKKKMAERKPPPSSPDAVERVVHAVVLPAVRLKQQNPLDHNRPISKEPAFTMEQLVEQIKQQIEPASWKNPKHTITTLGQNMIIEQTRANHLKINAFLKQLGITREQVEDERIFAEEQEQIRRDIAFRQEQERERMEMRRSKAQEDEKRKQEEENRKKEEERRKKQEAEEKQRQTQMK